MSEHSNSGIAASFDNPIAVQPTSPSQMDSEDASRCRSQALAREWKAATLYLSSISAKAMHPAYQQIIGMGKEALPLLLGELRQKPDHWFWALQAITGQNPVPASDRGNMTKMALAWLEWGKDLESTIENGLPQSGDRRLP